MIRSGIVAIDGPAASGKSSTARAVAERLGFAHLDSGALYRGVTYVTIEEAARVASSDNPATLIPPEIMLRATEDRGFMLQPDGAGFAAYIDGAPADTRIRTREVTAHVSAVSAIPVVREWVNAHLRELARAGIGVVVDGRDIGTVVFPEADLKVFLTATPEARALRRLRQVGAADDAQAVEREAAVLAARDAADSARVVAPLRRPHDAIEIDTSALSFDAQVERIVYLAREALSH
jgi:CMP/dCMP kinase